MIPITPTEQQISHLLMVDIIGRRSATKDVLWRSRFLLFEILSGCATYEAAILEGQVLTIPEPGRLVILFLSDQTSPVRCALELYEAVTGLPSLAIRVGIHSGRASISIDKRGVKTISGDGASELRRLVETGKEGEILLSESYAQSLEKMEGWDSSVKREREQNLTRYRVEPQKLFFLNSGSVTSEGQVNKEDDLRAHLEVVLAEDGYNTSELKSDRFDLAWAQSVESQIREADTVVAFVSTDDAENEFLQYQLEVAEDERRKRGRPQILSVPLEDESQAPSPFASLDQDIEFASWQSKRNHSQVISEVRAALATGITESDSEMLNSAGGAVPVNSKFYVHRPADDEFDEALARHESIILVKGPRQIGKTSLIARGIEVVHGLGWRCASTDFQQLSTRQLSSEEDFYKVIALTLSRQLGFPYDFETQWIEALGPNLNLDGFMRDLIDASDLPLVWFLDEADRLFSSPFASDFFGLVRSWHNARATDRRGPWGHLTLVIGYATEAHLFIRDLNQSPFNVGCALRMTMFTLENTRDLNERYGEPLKQEEDLIALHRLVGGQPFLIRRAFDVLSRGTVDFQTLVAQAHLDDGPFGDHLKRVLVSVSQLPFVWEAIRTSFSEVSFPDSEGVHRLVAAGILIRNSQGGYDLPSELYVRYLGRFVFQDWEPKA
jgi:hypothetical protein